MSPRRCIPGLSVILTLLLLLAGCIGQPSTGREPAHGETPGMSSAVLGNLRTLDPCTLIAPADLSRFGRVRNAGTVSLDYCLLHVRTADDTLLQLAVGELHHVDPAELTGGKPVVRRKGLRIVREAPLPGHCSRQILFSDGIAMRVSADMLSGDRAARLCSVAEAGAKAAVDAIVRGELGHRSYPANSLALIDPCTLMDPEVVHQVPGLERARPKHSPSHHQCQWGKSSLREPSVRLVHTAGDPPRLLHGTAVEERIAGRRTVISVVGGDPGVPLCSAETAHIPFGAPGSGQVEVAMLVVSLPRGDGIRACEFARGIAEHVWPRLPAP